MIDERKLAWSYLSRVVEGPSANLQDLLRQGKDVEAIVAGIKRRETWIGGLQKETAARAEWDTAQRDLDIIKQLDGRLVTPDDEEWPSEELDHAFGFAASGLSDHIRTFQDDAVAPHALWVRGGNIRSLLAQSVTVVGTRATSSYGAEVTSMFCEKLAAHQWTIVSGGALGVDTNAHKAALRAGGATAAVLACGLDRSYPAHNKQLFEDIVASGRGALISEYPPGTSPQRHRFLTRNRLVAALTTGTVVIEAAWRSGALNTLSWASGLGRVAMAVPGPVTTVGSLGCHERIKSGRAEMVTSADDIRSLLGAIGGLDSSAQYELNFAASPIQALSRNELRVFDALDTEPQEAQQIAISCGLSLPLVVHLLVELHRKSIISRKGSLWHREKCSLNSGNTEIQN